MPMLDPKRAAAQTEARRLANRARVRAGTSTKLLADVMCINYQNVFAAFEPNNPRHQQLTLADLVMYAHDPDGVAFLECLFAELYAIMAVHKLSVSDAESMAKRPDLAPIMAMVLRPMAELLWPEKMLPTGEPENVQTVAAVATGPGLKKVRNAK